MRREEFLDWMDRHNLRVLMVDTDGEAIIADDSGNPIAKAVRTNEDEVIVLITDDFGGVIEWQ